MAGQGAAVSTCIRTAVTMQVTSPPHQCLVNCGPQVEHMVADGQVVLQAEGLQNHAIPHGEGEPQLVVVVGWVKTRTE